MRMNVTDSSTRSLRAGRASISVLVPVALLIWGCSSGPMERYDSARQLSVELSGSLQNGAWSPDGESIVLTRFRDGYNNEPADLYLFNPTDSSLTELVSDGSANVNLPGASWNETLELIVFSSSRDPHDEIFVIDDGGGPGDEVQLTDRADSMAYEPSFSPDGQWVLFESHPLDVEDEGVVTKFRSDGSGSYVALTESADDCRQPNWSPAGDLILYQRHQDRQWDIWVMGTDGSGKRKVTSGPGDKTDASFSPDGQWIVYSSDGDLEFANLFVVSIAGGEAQRVTEYDGYDGAPSWSSSGQLVFESYPGDPDDSSGTTLWVIDAPAL